MKVNLSRAPIGSRWLCENEGWFTDTPYVLVAKFRQHRRKGYVLVNDASGIATTFTSNGEEMVSEWGITVVREAGGEPHTKVLPE